MALDEAHHIERLVVHRPVFAKADGGRYGDSSRSEGGDDLVLPTHVVGGGQDAAEGRAPEHPCGARRVVDPERQVRPASSYQIELERGLHALDVILEPLGDVVDVDAFDG